MLKYFYEFITNFLIGGSILGTYSVIIKYFNPNLVAQANGSLPLVFTYIIYKVFQNNNRIKASNIALVACIAAFIWQLFVLTTSILIRFTNFDIIPILIISLILFMFISYNFYKIVN